MRIYVEADIYITTQIIENTHQHFRERFDDKNEESFSLKLQSQAGL